MNSETNQRWFYLKQTRDDRPETNRDLCKQEAEEGRRKSLKRITTDPEQNNTKNNNRDDLNQRFHFWKEPKKKKEKRTPEIGFDFFINKNLWINQKLHLQEYFISRNVNFKINYLFHIHVSKPSRYYNLLFWLFSFFFFSFFCFLFLGVFLCGG